MTQTTSTQPAATPATTAGRVLVDGPNAWGRFWVFTTGNPRGDLFWNRDDANAFAALLRAGDLAEAEGFRRLHTAAF